MTLWIYIFFSASFFYLLSMHFAHVTFCSFNKMRRQWMSRCRPVASMSGAFNQLCFSPQHSIYMSTVGIYMCTGISLNMNTKVFGGSCSMHMNVHTSWIEAGQSLCKAWSGVVRGCIVLSSNRFGMQCALTGIAALMSMSGSNEGTPRHCNSGLVFRSPSLQEQKTSLFHRAWGKPLSNPWLDTAWFVLFMLWCRRIPETDESDLPDGLRSTLRSQLSSMEGQWRAQELTKWAASQAHEKTPRARFYLERATGQRLRGEELKSLSLVLSCSFPVLRTNLLRV